MAKFAPVCPIWLYRQLDELNMLGNYHLLLAHDVAEKHDEYSKLFGAGFKTRYPSGYTILDNSLIELGQPADDKIMALAHSVIRPDVVVLPDYPHDYEKTVAESRRAYSRWHNIGIINFMCVAQGNTLNEYIKCAIALVEMAGVNVIGIPRNAVAKLGSRFELTCKMFKATRKYLPQLHLLGFSDDVLDDITCGALPFIHGIDSSVPVRAGMDNVWLGSPYEYLTYTESRGTFWTDEKPITAAAVQNIQRVRAWLQIPM